MAPRRIPTRLALLARAESVIIECCDYHVRVNPDHKYHVREYRLWQYHLWQYRLWQYDLRLTPDVRSVHGHGKETNEDNVRENDDREDHVKENSFVHQVQSGCSG